MLLHGDCLEQMRSLDDNSIDCVVTDPPYGLEFMGKKWDYDVPSTEVWIEALRVLKPGGHLLSFGGTRTYHRLVVSIEGAGFEIRDQIQWIYGTGFPKSHNLEGAHEGWGTALKPANEPICLARKPLEKGLTVAQNVEKWGTGALNIDGTRITGGKMDPRVGKNISYGDGSAATKFGQIKTNMIAGNPDGRWPANVLFDETAAAMLDEQSGQLSQCGGPKKTTHDAGMFGIGTPGRIYKEENRGASRFFYVAKSSKRERNAGLEGMPVKESRTGLGGGPMPIDDDGKERDRTKSFQQNIHPTVKPVKLMEYLIKLVCPPGGIVLDPFMGSGTTGVAAKSLGVEFIGIERESEYIEIARKRIAL